MMAAMIEELAYVVVAGADLNAWARFGEELLGCFASRSGTTLALKMDDRPFRYLVSELPGSAFPTLGWRVSDAAAMARAAMRVEALGLAVSPIPQSELATRGAGGGLRFLCRNGITHEIVHDVRGHSTFRPAADVTGFVTGGGGMGHTAWLVPDVASMDALMIDALGMSLREDISTPTMRGHFYGCNQRHHSLAAFGDKPLHLEHLMAEMNELDDVGRAMDRCEVLGYKVLQPLGRHRTDHMVSFYVETPSGFGMEIGFNAVLCGDDWAEQREGRRKRAWGHGAAVRNHQREATSAQSEKSEA
jgi:3,4-dihydroxy-9,10-secoandrosta-1,3,5(10)-triene-9,17-dione 4,5-dioxygenase